MVVVHGPSIALGAGIAAAVTVAVFLGASWDDAALPEGAAGTERERELVLVVPGEAGAGEAMQQRQPSPHPQPGQPPPDDSAMASAILDNGSPVLGNPLAPVTLVEFGDYQCHYCNVFHHETRPAILEDYVDTGKVRMIFKDYHIIGPDSVEASHAAHCAGGQGAFWEYHNALYDNWAGENTGWASFENLRMLAGGVQGLDVDEWTQCMGEKPHSQIILLSNRDARTLGLGGTPTFYIIGHDGEAAQIVGAQSYEYFARMLDARLEAAVASES